MPLLPPTPTLIAHLAAIVGPGHALTTSADQAAYLTEWRGLYTGRTLLVLRPGSTAEVSAILSACHEARVGVVPQGGNTGLVGGQIPFETGREIVVSLARLNRIRHVDPHGRHMTAEAGVTLASVQAEADRHGQFFPLSLASEGTCQIGGNLATNAGGLNVLAYGNAREQVSGLEVVLADGRVWDGLRALKKDNTGYDLRDLFIGSEGTLGIITAAVLKLRPRPAERYSAFLAVADLDAALAVFKRAEAKAGSRLTAFEFLSAFALRVVLAHVAGTRAPFGASYPWYLLLEVSAPEADGSGASLLEELLTALADDGLILKAVLPQTEAGRAAVWRLREELSDAQRHEGGSIKHDVSVPVEQIAEFIRRADSLVEQICPGARPCAFGHFGDGNIHYNVTQPAGMEKAAYLALWGMMNEAIHTLIAEMGGSISAEHGIGRLKRAELARFRSKVELDLMRALKAALDPRGILNPGKVIDVGADGPQPPSI
ncbi:MAG: FAD-binding oxidoreductase [Hyphomicrobiaceae bacterium]|nr:FAD-binding oxidoreductase [Hyphomicrobiaceae bacterium]